MTDTVETGVTATLPQGQTALPNDGQVASSGVGPNDPESGVDTQQPNTPDQADSPQPMTPAPAGSMQQPQPMQQPQQPQQQPPPPKPPAPKGVDPSNPHADNPLVQKAGVLHTVMQALGGGPHFTYKVDPNTGEMQKTEVPRSKTDIGMAIALEAISGGLAGLSQHGPAALGKAGVAGLQVGQEAAQQRQAADQRAQQQASQDYARHAQILDTNMKMYMNAQQVGRLGQESNQKYVDSYKELNDLIEKQYPQASLGVVDYKDFSKYHVTAQNAIPYRQVPRPDSNDPSKQAVDKYGTPQWDIQYRVIDPNFKAGNFLTAKMRADAAKWNIGNGFSDEKGNATQLPTDIATKLGQATNFQAQIGAMNLAEGELQDYYDTLDKQEGDGNYSFGDLKAPIIPDANTQAAVDEAAARNQVPKEIARALVMQESGGKQMGADGKPKLGPANHTGERAIGLTQLLPSTAKAMGVDPNDATANVEGGMKYLGQLIQKYHGNARLALAAYNAGPDNVTDHVPDNGQTKQYVDSIVGMTGLSDQPGAQGALPKYTPVNLAAAAKADPMLAKAVMDFQSFGNKTDNLSQSLAAFAKSNPQEGNKLYQLYGGKGAARVFDNANALSLKQAEVNITQTAELKKSQTERAQKLQENQQAYEEVARSLAGDANDPGSGDMTSLDKIISQRTADRPKVYAMAKAINPNFNSREADAKYAVWKSFVDPNGKGAAQITSFNALMQHIGQGIDVNEAYRRTDSDLLNKPWNWLQQHALNNPEVGRFEAAQAPIRTEYLKLLQNNNALTQADKVEGESMFNKADTPARLEAVMKTMAVTAAIRIRAQNSTWNRVFGNGHNLPNLVAPETVDAISKMTDESGHNETANVLQDMDTGGTIVGSANGRGTPGKTVKEALGVDYAGPGQPQQQPQAASAQPQAAPTQQPQAVPSQSQYKVTPLGQSSDGKQIIGKDAQGNWVDAVTGVPIGK